jgi:hypothetical protein
MAISINPIFPVIAAQGAAADVTLQPGTVIDAQVLKVLANDMVRIAVANLAIEVMSEIPLQVGQALQLAVSQTSDGIRLAVVGQTVPGEQADTSSLPAITDTVALAPEAAVGATAKPIAAAQPQDHGPTALEALAASAAAQSAAIKQGSLAPLFANLGLAVTQDDLPPAVQQAAMQLLARRTVLDESLSGRDVKTAFEASGLFLEKSLAGSAVGSPVSAGPDLKAALLVLRHVLSAQADATRGPVNPAAEAPIPAQRGMIARDPSASPQTGVAAMVPRQPEMEVDEYLSQLVRMSGADDPTNAAIVPRGTAVVATLRGGVTDAVALRAAVSMLQDISAAADGPPAAAWRGGGVSDDVVVRTNLPPPPYRDALPSPQPVALPSLPPNASKADMIHHLLQDADAALARQTLLQVASLPDRADASAPRNDQIGPRWNFEIPFATPQGTAVAQFEIAGEGGGNGVETAKRVWRARFSLDVEPAGPVHALVSLIGDTTSVRMWAERPVTAGRLRAGVAELSAALDRAELNPGDIVVRAGVPPQTAAAPAGHFVDRAL